MSLPSRLMAEGMPAGLAARVGNEVITATAAGTTFADATTLQGGHIYVVSGASNAGLIITSLMSIGSVWMIACASGSAGSVIVYPPVGATITNVSTATGVTVAANKNMIVWRYSTALLFHVILG